MAQLIYGKNVINQFSLDDKKISEIYISDNFKDIKLLDRINKLKIKTVRVNKKRLDALCDNQHHQGIACYIDDYETYDIDDLLVSKLNFPLLVMLDGIQDPHNLGAILRTCDCVGVDGVIIGKNRCCGLTPTVAKVSTGAIDTVKIAQVTNLSSTIEYLKKKGYWIIGADMNKSVQYDKQNYDMPVVLVIGSEGKGISNLVAKHCDLFVHLPMLGMISSLNASVATAVILYEMLKVRK